jgi:RimJ/RimL family protein N-acetyltransferase
MKYFKKLVGKKCYLSPINVDDYEIFTQWLNDVEVTKNLNLIDKNITLLSEKEALINISKNHTYSIIDLSKEILIGNCGLININQVNRTAEIGIIIGNKYYWNKGYGEEAIKLLLDYSFKYLNLQNIMLSVFSFNERGIKCYKKIGFKEIGRRRKAIIQEDKEYDIIFMDLLNTEFIYNK